MGNAASGRFGFVVLHYLVDEATMQCVESIRRCCVGRDYHIVVAVSYTHLRAHET